MLRAALSLQAYETLQIGLEDIMAMKKGNLSRSLGGFNSRRSREASLRGFLANAWVNDFHDVIMHDELAVPGKEIKYF